MAPHASSVVTRSLAREPEQFPATPRVAPADSPAVTQESGRLRPLEVAQCSLCGIALPQVQSIAIRISRGKTPLGHSLGYLVSCSFLWCREGGSNPHDRKGRRILRCFG